MTTSVCEPEGRARPRDPPAELVGAGARQILHLAVEAELQDVLAGLEDRRLEDGRAGVVQGGYLPERAIRTGIGPAQPHAEDPLQDRRAGGLPPGQGAPRLRKSRSLDAAVPRLWLEGVSTGGTGPALEALVGPEARGLSASTALRLKAAWRQEYDEWRRAPLDRDRRVHAWVDGIHGGPRAGHAKLCCLQVSAPVTGARSTCRR